MGRKGKKIDYKAISKTLVAVIIVVVIVIAIGGVYAFLSSQHSPAAPSSTTTSFTSTTSSTTTSSVLNTSNPQALMQLVGISTPPSTPVTITVWNSYSTSENQAFNETLAQFEQAFPWIHVQVTYGV